LHVLLAVYLLLQLGPKPTISLDRDEPTHAQAQQQTQ
jgi:hypothetical protein